MHAQIFMQTPLFCTAHLNIFEWNLRYKCIIIIIIIIIIISSSSSRENLHTENPFHLRVFEIVDD